MDEINVNVVPAWSGAPVRCPDDGLDRHVSRAMILVLLAHSWHREPFELTPNF